MLGRPSSLIPVRLILLTILYVLPLAAATRQFSSGEHRTHLLELFSSEGCSSCPPAEAWLGGLRTAPSLWRDFVPVAFHVAYWDLLGWRDRFATREFTARQYAYASVWGGDSVYTPAFVLDGTEWRYSAEGPGQSAERVGVLSVEYSAEGICRVKFAGEGEVHAAILGGGIVSPVLAGENAGRTLNHEFVALSLTNGPLVSGVAEIKLPVPAVPGVSRHALAVWVTRGAGLTPVQATGGWLD